MQNDAADQLHVEVAHAGRADAGFSNDRKSFGQNLVEDFSFASLAFFFVSRVSDGLLHSLFENRGARAQFVVGKRLHRRFECVDLLDQRCNRFQKPLITAAENFS